MRPKVTPLVDLLELSVVHIREGVEAASEAECHIRDVDWQAVDSLPKVAEELVRPLVVIFGIIENHFVENVRHHIVGNASSACDNDVVRGES